MAERGSGSIISLSSMAGQVGLAGGAAYSATASPCDAPPVLSLMTEDLRR